jgi:transposase
MDFDPKETDVKYCGIDLHSNNSVVIVSDEEDRIVFNKRLPNDLGQIRAALETHQEELVGVVIESTYNWYWLVDGQIPEPTTLALLAAAAIAVLFRRRRLVSKICW